MTRPLLIASALSLLLTGCVTIRQTDPARTATEQLLISSAADRAAAALKVDLPDGAAIFIDTSNFEGYDSKYAIGAITDRLLHDGARVVADKDKADVIVALRAGALSTDDHSILIGLPSIPIPVPFAASVSTPEIALFKKDTDQGVAKFAVTGYGAKDGKLVVSSGPTLGYSEHTRYVVLLFISWQSNDLVPDQLNK